MTRFGVRTQTAFLTNVVIVLVGKANALTMMQLIHHALRDLATPLAVDDSTASSPAYFFDLAPPDLRVALSADASADAADAGAAATGVPVRASVFGVKGMANAHLSALLASAHALVVLSDGADDPTIAARTLAARMPTGRTDDVYAVRVADTDQARAALLAVLEDLAEKVSV